LVGTLHTLRHTAATLMLVGDVRRGVPPEPVHVVAARNRMKSLETRTQRYGGSLGVMARE
jgi:integrase